MNKNLKITLFLVFAFFALEFLEFFPFSMIIILM